MAAGMSDSEWRSLKKSLLAATRSTAAEAVDAAVRTAASVGGPTSPGYVRSELLDLGSDRFTGVFDRIVVVGCPIAEVIPERLAQRTHPASEIGPDLLADGRRRATRVGGG